MEGLELLFPPLTEPRLASKVSLSGFRVRMGFAPWPLPRLGQVFGQLGHCHLAGDRVFVCTHHLPTFVLLFESRRPLFLGQGLSLAK